MSHRLRYPEIAPEGYGALSSFGHYVNTSTSLGPVLLGLVYLRASVLNGCGFCTELHKAELRKHHEPETRIEAVLSDPSGDAFTPRERAALRWTEVLTRLPGTAEGAPDAEYDAAAVFFHDKDLVDLSFAIANINAWNRMGIAFRPTWRPRTARHAAPDPIREGERIERGEMAAALPDSESKIQTIAVVDDDGGKVGQG